MGPCLGGVAAGPCSTDYDRRVVSSGKCGQLVLRRNPSVARVALSGGFLSGDGAMDGVDSLDAAQARLGGLAVKCALRGSVCGCVDICGELGPDRVRRSSGSTWMSRYS